MVRFVGFIKNQKKFIKPNTSIYQKKKKKLKMILIKSQNEFNRSLNIQCCNKLKIQQRII